MTTKYKAGYLIEVQNNLDPKFSRMLIEKAGEVWYEDTIQLSGAPVHRCLGTPTFESPETALQWKKEAEEWLNGAKYRVEVNLVVYNLDIDIDPDPDCPYYLDLIKMPDNTYYAVYDEAEIADGTTLGFGIEIEFDLLEIIENLGRD